MAGDIMAKMGRPQLLENEPRARATFEVMMGIVFIEKDTICSLFGCSRSTLERWIKKEYNSTFDALKSLKRKDMHLKLAAKQYELAVIKGNVPMLIWLGKNWLDQKDKHESEIGHKTIQITIDPDDSLA